MAGQNAQLHDIVMKLVSAYGKNGAGRREVIERAKHYEDVLLSMSGQASNVAFSPDGAADDVRELSGGARFTAELLYELYARAPKRENRPVFWAKKTAGCILDTTEFDLDGRGPCKVTRAQRELGFAYFDGSIRWSLDQRRRMSQASIGMLVPQTLHDQLLAVAAS